ncbi:MAG TPA: metallophosphoesterase family protein [Verrucomicrobiae bacterium]|nr:metallophosphoesterase family protein [Verrucomicrobiae bacterium]
MRTLAIGDIHGSNAALVTLLTQVQPGPTDHVIFIGDYVDRGPSSCQVVETLLELRKSCSPVFLRGNHDVMMLEAREGSSKRNLWLSYGGIDTLDSYGTSYHRDWISVVPDAHWAFLEQSVKYFETESHIFVHACLDPELEMKQQPDWLLYWESFDRVQPHKSGKTIICGHTPQGSGEIKNIGFAMCIDTKPAGGGWLTCLDVESGEFWQSNEKGSIRDGTL